MHELLYLLLRAKIRSVIHLYVPDFLQKSLIESQRREYENNSEHKVIE